MGTKEYLSVSFKGYDGYGTATVSLDREELIAKLYGKDATDEEQDAVHDGVSVSVDGSEALSNGDKVKVTVDVDKESAVASKIKFETYTYDVSGLTETTEISSQDLVKSWQLLILALVVRQIIQKSVLTVLFSILLGRMVMIY